MRRTSGPNKWDRPLVGAGEPAESRTSSGQGQGGLSYAQAVIASLTARRAVAREEWQPAGSEGVVAKAKLKVGDSRPTAGGGVRRKAGRAASETKGE
jgi:hypothetical protein